MTVISMDAFDQAQGRIPRQRTSFQRRNAVASLPVGNDRQPTEFGYHLLRLMGGARINSAQLARAANVSGSTVTRLIYGGSRKPDDDTLGRVAHALVAAEVAAGADIEDFGAAVEGRHNELLFAAGRRVGVAVEMPPMHPRAVQLNQALGEGTPLTAEEVAFLDSMVGQLLAPYAQRLRKRTG